MILKISTPSGIILENNDVTLLTAMGVEGEFGIMKGHIPFTTRLNEGIVKIKTSKGHETLAIGPAFFEVANDTITILADHAILPKDADKKRAEEARKRAEAILQKKIQGTDFTMVEAELRKALLELKLVESING